MHYMTVLVIEYESTAYQQYKMAKKKLGVFFQFFAREATLKFIFLRNYGWFLRSGSHRIS